MTNAEPAAACPIEQSCTDPNHRRPLVSSNKKFETVRISDKGSDGNVDVEVMVIETNLPEQAASVFLTLELRDGGGEELIADLTPEMARKLSSALDAAAAEAVAVTLEATR